MNKFHLFIQKIHDLSATQKTLSPEALEHLTKKVEEYVNNQDHEVELDEIIYFVVTYVYNEAYLSALNDVLAELHTVR